MAIGAVLNPRDVPSPAFQGGCGTFKTYNVSQVPNAEHLTKAAGYLLTAVRKHAVIEQLKSSEHKLKPIVRNPQDIPALEIPEIFTMCDLIYSRFANLETSNYESDLHELQQNNKDTETLYAQRLENLKEAIAKEKESTSWGIAVKAFSWMGSFLSIITGIALVATGVGAVGGALMIMGGVIHIGMQLIEITGGWSKILKLLPGDDPTQKSAVLTWIQISVTVLCLVLAGAGVVFGGLSAVKDSLSWAQAMMGAIALSASGVCLIGKGIKDKQWKYKHADVTKDDMELAKLKHRKDELMDSVDRTSFLMEKITELQRSVIHNKEQLSQEFARG